MSIIYINLDVGGTNERNILGRRMLLGYGSIFYQKQYM